MTEAVLYEPDPSKRRHALLRHEWTIASAALGAMVRKPLDLLTVLIAFPVGILVLRAWTVSQPAQLVDLQAVAVGFAVAFYCVKALISRCLYHRTDGILAADAQLRSEQLAFAVPLFGAAAALGFVYLVIVDAQRPVLWLAATTLGAVAGYAWANVARLLRERQPIVLGWLRPRFLGRARAQAVLVAGGAMLGTAIAFLPLELPASVIAAAAISLFVGIVLGRIDASAVRYRAMVGHAAGTIVGSHIAPLASFFGPFAAALTLASHWGLPAMVMVLGLAIAGFVAMRVLAYQSFQRRIADWFVTGLIAMVAIFGLALPPAAPVVLLLGIFWLARRAASQTWLIA